MKKFFHFLFCSWTDWQTTAEGLIVAKGLTKGYWKRQERVCKICKREEMRREECW